VRIMFHIFLSEYLAAATSSRRKTVALQVEAGFEPEEAARLGGGDYACQETIKRLNITVFQRYFL